MTLSTISRIAEIIFGVMWAIGLIMGVIAWAKRGYAIPRGVHVTACVVAGVGVVTAVITSLFGIQSGGFALMALVVFPIWVYVIWILLGCPYREKQGEPRSAGSPVGIAGDDKKE